MEINVDKNKISFSHVLKRNETYKVIKGEKFFTISFFKRPTLVKGFTNACEDLKYIPLFDFDNTYKYIVLEDARLLQEKYNLPPFYLFTTKEEKTEEGEKGNYHLISLKKFDYKEVCEIIGDSRCDPNYKTMNFRTPYKSWVIRISPKGTRRGRPKFVSIVGEQINLDAEISSPHLELLKKLYPEIKHPDFTNKDKLKIIKIQEYQTLNF